MLMLCSDPDFERLNISFKENIPDGVDLNFNRLNCCIRKTEGENLQFSEDCFRQTVLFIKLNWNYKSPGLIKSNDTSRTIPLFTFKTLRMSFADRMCTHSL